MALAFLRTAASGGSDPTVTTAAAMWGKITDCLLAAGWTSAYQYVAGSDEVFFTNGESGNERAWVRIRQSGNTLNFLIHQYFSTSGTVGGFNRIGATSSSVTNTHTLTSASALNYLMIADKDSFFWYATEGTQQWFQTAGLFLRAAGIKSGYMLTTAPVDPGKMVTVPLATDPSAAGYKRFDMVMLLGQQTITSGTITNATVGSTGIIPAFMAEIRDLTSNSITVTEIKERLETGAMVGENPQPLYLFSSAQDAQISSGGNFAMIRSLTPGGTNSYLGQSGMGGGFVLSAPYSISKDSASLCDPNQRTGRMLYSLWQFPEGALLPARIWYHPRQTDPLWFVVRDGKTTSSNKDYVVVTISTVRYALGPFPQAGSAGFTGVQVMSDPAELWTDGLELAEPNADYWDCEDPVSHQGAAQLYDLDEGMLFTGEAIPLRPTKNPELSGTGPYLLNDGDRTSGAGGSNFNSGFN